MRLLSESGVTVAHCPVVFARTGAWRDRIRKANG